MPPARVLLVRAGALGDILLLRRAIAALQATGRTVGLLAPSHPASALLGAGPGDVLEALPWESAAFAGLLSDDGLASGAAADALRRYDTAVVYSRRGELVRAVARLVPTVVAHDPAPPADGPHAAAWLASCLPRLGIAVGEDAVPPLVPSADDRARAAGIATALPPRFLALHPGSGSPAKNWPAARFAELARAAGGAGWLLVRGPADDDAAGALESLPGAHIAHDLPLRVLAALIARAGAYVGNDSGVTHLAAASGAPTIALFGPTDPGVWAPIGPRVEILRGERMDEIAVDAVAAAVARARAL